MSDEKPPWEILLRVPIFRGFNETECRQMADVAHVESYVPGEIILKQGDTGQNLWVMLEGKCEVVRFTDDSHAKQHPLVLALLEPFSHFGEMSFFHPAPHSASVRAQGAVKVLRIARVDYDDMIHEGIGAAYKLAYNSVESLADRLRRMDQWVAELASHEPSQEQVPEWTRFRNTLFSGWNL